MTAVATVIAVIAVSRCIVLEKRTRKLRERVEHLRRWLQAEVL